MVTNRLRSITFGWVLLFVLNSLVVAEESLPSSWECLPEGTVFAARIPNGSEFASALVSNTKLGSAIFNEEKKAGLIKAFEESGEEWSRFQKGLKEFGLTTDDLMQMLAGETGIAMLLDYEVTEEPYPSAIAWLEPGEELTGRAFEIIAKAISLQEDAKHPVRRLDLEIAGREVMQLQIPSLSFQYTKNFERVDTEGLSEEEQREAWKKAYDEYRESRQEVLRHQTVLVCPYGSKLLLAFATRPAVEEKADEQIEIISSILGNWLEAHERGEGGFVSRLTSEVGVSRTMALEGVSGLEMLCDCEAFVRLMDSTIAQAQGRNGEVSEKTMEFLGFKGIGPAALKLSLQGEQLRSALSLAAPSPRRGLMTFLDQDPLPAEPPAWVPNSVIRYVHANFDLGEFVSALKEELTKVYPERAEQMFGMADMQLNNFAQTNLMDLLNSIDSRHTMISFGYDKEMDSSSEAEQVEKMAFIWSVNDEGLWSRVMDVLISFGAMSMGAESIEEQGYRGMRVKNESFEGGFVLGKGRLVLGIGTEVLETTLSILNNPPNSEDTLRSSELYERASEMIDLEPCMAVEITDGSRYMRNIWQLMENLIHAEDENAQLMVDFEDEEDEYEDENEYEVEAEDVFWKQFRRLLPSADDVGDMFGVIATRFEVNEDGLFVESVTELPGQ